MSKHASTCFGPVVGLLGMAIGLGLVAAPAMAATTLTDDNSTALIDLSSSAGFSSWKVDGKEHLKQQWFWYRVGAAGAEKSLDTLTLNASVTTDTNADGNIDTLYARYLGAGYKVEVTYVLRGGATGTGTSGLGETIRIINTGASNLDFHFFQYSDFDLPGGGSDTVEIKGGNTADQTGGPYMVEEVVTWLPAHYQADLYSTILDSLTDASPTTLTDAPGPVTGNATWAFQWDQTIRPGKSFLLGKSTNIVPEPATLTLVGGALIAALVRRRK